MAEETRRGRLSWVSTRPYNFELPLVTSTHLHATLSHELVTSRERHLNDSSQFGQLLGSVGLDVGNTLEVGCEESRDQREGGGKRPMEVLSVKMTALGNSDKFHRYARGVCYRGNTHQSTS